MKKYLYFIFTLCILTPSIHANDLAIPTQVYKSCEHRTHGPRYNVKTSSQCGIKEVIETARRECGTNYLSCNTLHIPKEERMYPANHIAVIPNQNTYESCETKAKKALTGKANIYLISNTSEYQDDLNSKSKVITWDGVVTDPTIPQELNSLEYSTLRNIKHSSIQIAPFVWSIHSVTTIEHNVGSPQTCIVKFYKSQIVAGWGPHPICGVESYKTCEETVYNKCEHPSFGFAGYKESATSVCGLNENVVPTLSDDAYSELVQNEIERFTATYSNKNLWDNLKELFSERNLNNRTINYNLLSYIKLKIISLNSNRSTTDYQNKYTSTLSFLLLDYYSRILLHYQNQRAQDVLFFDSLLLEISQDSLKNIELQITDRINKININEQLREQIINKFKSSTSNNLQELRSVIIELKQIIVNEILYLNKDYEELLASVVPTAIPSKFSKISMLISKRNYNLAISLIQEARIFFRNRDFNSNLPLCGQDAELFSNYSCETDSELVNGNWLFNNLKDNAILLLNKELRAAQALYTRISNSPKATSLTHLNEDLPIESQSQILEVHIHLQISLDDMTGERKLETLDYISKNIIDPLSNIESEFNKR